MINFPYYITRILMNDNSDSLSRFETFSLIEKYETWSMDFFAIIVKYMVITTFYLLCSQLLTCYTNTDKFLSFNYLNTKTILTLNFLLPKNISSPYSLLYCDKRIRDFQKIEIFTYWINKIYQRFAYFLLTTHSSLEVGSFTLLFQFLGQLLDLFVYGLDFGLEGGYSAIVLPSYFIVFIYLLLLLILSLPIRSLTNRQNLNPTIPKISPPLHNRNQNLTQTKYHPLKLTPRNLHIFLTLKNNLLQNLILRDINFC